MNTITLCLCVFRIGKGKTKTFGGPDLAHRLPFQRVCRKEIQAHMAITSFVRESIHSNNISST